MHLLNSEGGIVVVFRNFGSIPMVASSVCVCVVESGLNVWWEVRIQGWLVLYWYGLC